jgi:ribosome-associated translation inhibitor RaiA
MKLHMPEPMIVVRGEVPEDLVSYARQKVLALATDSSVPVLDIELRLDHHADPARERPNCVEITIDFDGVLVRARGSGPTMSEAIDGVLSRLRRRMHAAMERRQSRRLRSRDLESWHHGDRPAERSHADPRPAEDRMLVRRKTFALEAESIEEALFDLEALDHDFLLFVHDESNAEAVVYRVGDGYGLMQRRATPDAVGGVEIPLVIGPHPASTTVENALSILDSTAAPFEFFIDAATGNGMVAYRRHDGDYGLITSS